eukprot:566217-Lingulodinium_polyedra.AAC.1
MGRRKPERRAAAWPTPRVTTDNGEGRNRGGGGRLGLHGARGGNGQRGGDKQKKGMRTATGAPRRAGAIALPRGQLGARGGQRGWGRIGPAMAT